VDHYDYRLDGGNWVLAGGGTSTTIDNLKNGQSYTLEVRACNDRSDYPESSRCGPAGDARSGVPFGELTPPTVSAKVNPADAQQVTVSWGFPDTGNGRKITARTVKISGVDDVRIADGSWVGAVGYAKTVTATVQYCVEGPDACSDEVTAKVTTPAAPPAPTFSLATVALAPLTGTCGAGAQYDGEWRTDAECGGGLVVAPAPVEVKCIDQAGVGYPEVPAGNKPDPIAVRTDWYLSSDNKWYRAAAFAPAGTTIPACG
jgi:hypothetical protein